MKKLIFPLLFLLFTFSATGQTQNELMGKWQLVKWTHNGKEKDIIKNFKTEEVYQVFLDDNKFHSVIGDKTKKGKWKLSKDNSRLTITSALIPVKFKIVSFDAQKRVVKHASLGVMEYVKVD